MKYRVQATSEGQYNQYLHVVGEVFDLMMNADGTMPLKMKQKKVPDFYPSSHPQAGKETFHLEDSDEPELDEDGEPIHRDFASDGVEARGTALGFAGDTFRHGWMRRVPDDTPLGIYPADQLFTRQGQERKAPISRVVLPSNHPTNAPRSAPIMGEIDRTFRQAG